MGPEGMGQQGLLHVYSEGYPAGMYSCPVHYAHPTQPSNNLYHLQAGHQWGHPPQHYPAAMPYVVVMPAMVPVMHHASVQPVPSMYVGPPGLAAQASVSSFQAPAHNRAQHHHNHHASARPNRGSASGTPHTLPRSNSHEKRKGKQQQQQVPSLGGLPLASKCHRPLSSGTVSSFAGSQSVSSYTSTAVQTPGTSPADTSPATSSPDRSEDESDVQQHSSIADSSREASPPSSQAATEVATESTRWADLTVGILQGVIDRLRDHEVKQLRLVCRYWRAAVDANLDTLSPSTLTPKWLSARFPNLKALHLTNCSNVRNRDLQLLSSGGLKLHTLTLGDDANRPWVSNLGMSWIGRISTLTALDLKDCSQITNKGLGCLQKLTGLTMLSLKGCNKINNMGMEALKHNTALTYLNISGCTRVSDKGLHAVTFLPHLKYLHLGCTRVKDEGMPVLARLTQLHSLRFMRESITDAGFVELTTLANLRTLSLRECSHVTGESLSVVLAHMPHLWRLDLFHCFAFDDAQLAKCMHVMGSATQLDLRGTKVSPEGVKQLAQLQNLQGLCLTAPTDPSTSQQQLCAVGQLTQLINLTLNNCRLSTHEQLLPLCNLRQLQELDLSNSALTTIRPCDLAAASEAADAGALQAIGTLTTLTSLDISRRAISEEQAGVLLGRLTKLQELHVVGCGALAGLHHSLRHRLPHLIIHDKPGLQELMQLY